MRGRKTGVDKIRSSCDIRKAMRVSLGCLNVTNEDGTWNLYTSGWGVAHDIKPDHLRKLADEMEKLEKDCLQ